LLLYVLPVIACAWPIARPRALLAPCAALLVLAAVIPAWIRRRYESAVLNGIAAAIPALLLPWALRGVGLVTVAGATFDPCIPACALAGLVAGTAIAIRASREERHWSFWIVSATVTAMIAVLGCSVAGEAGLLGLALGGALGTAPVLARRAWM